MSKYKVDVESVLYALLSLSPKQENRLRFILFHPPYLSFPLTIHHFKSSHRHQHHSNSYGKYLFPHFNDFNFLFIHLYIHFLFFGLGGKVGPLQAPYPRYSNVPIKIFSYLFFSLGFHREDVLFLTDGSGSLVCSSRSFCSHFLWKRMGLVRIV